MVAVISWWLAIQLIGLLALPLAWRLFARLPSRGYAAAKALGLLLASYILWLGASFHLLPNDLGGILAALVLLAVLSLWLGRAGLRRDADQPGAGRPLLRWLAGQRRLVVATELLLLITLAAWTVFRAYSGEIAATEKPMEFAFINGVLNSRFFPPQDPWLSGYAISYYYFGYVMLALLIRLTGVLPAVGFNLAVAMWYALVLVGAFGIVYDLVALAGQRRGMGSRAAPRAGIAGEDQQGAEVVSARKETLAARSAAGPVSGRPIGWGLLGALFVGIIGNLEGLVDAGYNAGFLPLSWIQWLDINDMFQQPPTGTWAGTGWWWWHASRVIHDRNPLGQSVEVINEFPFFSFLLGDLHPHVLALPFVLLALALALNLLLGVRSKRPGTGGATLRVGTSQLERRPASTLGFVSGDVEQGASALQVRVSSLQLRAAGFLRALEDAVGLGLPGVVLYGLILGGLAFLNTWDFPIYLALVALAFGLGLALPEGLSWRVAGRTVAAAIALGAIGWVAYLPFYVGFQSQAGGLLPNLLFPTRFSQFFLMFGLFLVSVVFFLLLVTHDLREAERARDHKAGLREHFLTLLPLPVLLPIALIALMLGLGALLPQGRALVNDLLNDPAVRSRLPVAAYGPLVALIARLRLATPWTYLFLAGSIAWTAALLWRGVEVWKPSSLRVPEPEGPEARPAVSPDADTPAHRIADLFALLLILLALLLAFSVEFVYLKDLFWTRMNTVFKFYYQAWILLALASAYGLSRLAERTAPVRLQAPALLLAILLGAVSMVYPLLSTPSKAGDFRGQPTLDGLAYLEQSGDAAAINWIRQNVSPAAVILEAPGGSYSPEGAERVSMATGNPTLLGWDFHERQWRGKAFDTLTAGRVDAVDRIYRSGRPEEIRDLLAQWDIDYVYVGALERNKYKLTDAALARFERAGLRVVYDAGGVRIYAR